MSDYVWLVEAQALIGEEEGAAGIARYLRDRGFAAQLKRIELLKPIREDDQ